MIDIKLDGIETVRKQLAPNIFKKATVKALNETAKQAYTAADAAIRQDFVLKKKDIKKEVKVYKAKGNYLTATIQVVGARIPLYAFSAKRTAKGVVTVKIKRTAGRKKVKGAFIAPMPSGHMGVYKRKAGAKRLPIRELTTVSIPDLFTTIKAEAAIIKAINDNLDKNLDRAIAFYIHRIKK